MHLSPEPFDTDDRFSILIPTWNNLAHLRLCIDSIRRHSRADHQIIVHVNDGQDGSLDWVRAEGLDHTHSSQNIGICLAVNGSGQLARNPWVVYMNDDMYCCPGWDSALMAKARHIGHDAFMLSGSLIEPRKTGNRCVTVADFGQDLASFREQELLAHHSSLDRPDWYGSTWPPTLVHRRWWHAVGGYSSEFSPGMASDNDFAMKMWHAGCRIFLGVGDSHVYHFMCKSTGRIVKNDGRGQFLRKWRMTPSVFDRYHVRRGDVARGLVLPEPDQDPAYARALWLARLKARWR